MGRIYTSENQLIMPTLIKIYETYNNDWLSYPITKKNILTIHHIIKLADGGKTDIDNLALLTKKAHRALHICENRDFILYSEINSFLNFIVEYRQALDDYLKEESKEYKKALTRVLYK